jgi:hypothetical protein
MSGSGEVVGKDAGTASATTGRVASHDVAVGIGVGMAVLFIVFCFTAYLDPAVFVPALNAFSFCG